MLQARLLLELFALGSLAARGPETMREAGSALLRDCQEARKHATSARAREFGREFHTRLMRAAGNTVQAELYEPLWNQQLRIAAAATAGPDHAATDMAEHAAIAAALHDQRPADPGAGPPTVRPSPASALPSPAGSRPTR
ncbi:FCD domain-containing protein [Streptomyces sp. NPDC003998]